MPGLGSSSVSDPVAQTVHQATLTLLERTGVRIGSDHALDLMAAHGVRVDFESRRVYPQEQNIQRALTTAPGCVRVYGHETGNPVVMEGDNAYVLAGGGSLRVLNLEGQLEASTWEHLRQFNVLLDALPNIHLCINQVDPQDDEGDGFYVRLAAEMLIGMPKPCLLQAFGASDVTAMLEMGIAIRGSRQALAERPVFMVAANAEPPLNISQHVADLLIAAFQAGLPSHLGNYNMMGITAPVTVAGAVVQINAVQMVALILSQIVRPGVALMYTVFSGDGNLRTLGPLTSSPRVLQQQRLAARVGHFYGLPVYGLAATDANMPDSQAACEIGVQLLMALETGCNLIQGPTSMMDSMMLSSFTQAVIDNDIVGYVLAARSEPEISAETLALEAMHEVATDPWLEDLKFAGHPHTVSHMRDDLWQPAAFAYDNVATGQRTDGRSVLERATAVAGDILHHHQPEPLPPEVANEIHSIAKDGA